MLKDVVEEQTQFDKDEALRLVPPKHQQKLDMLDTVYATGYRRTRNGKQQLELRFDGIAGCLRTPEGGSSKQYLVVKKMGQCMLDCLQYVKRHVLWEHQIALNYREAKMMDIRRWGMQWQNRLLNFWESGF